MRGVWGGDFLTQGVFQIRSQLAEWMVDTLLLVHTQIHQNTGVGYYASQRPEPVYIACVSCFFLARDLSTYRESLRFHPKPPAEPAKGGLRGLPVRSHELRHLAR